MPGRRSLLLSVALLAGALPACLHVSADIGPRKAVPITSPEQAAEMAADAKRHLKPAPKGEFAVLPSAPGTVVPVRSDAPPAPGAGANTTAQKPQAAPPAPPAASVKPAGGEPAPLPILPTALPTEAPLLAAVRAYTEGRPDRAIEIIRKLDKHNQDFVLAVLPVLTRGATADLANDPATAAALTEQLRGAAARIEPFATLKVEKVAFCRSVDGFGLFTPRPAADPYRPNERVMVYFELRNLGSQPAPDGFATVVNAAVELRDADNKLVPQIDPTDHRRVPAVRFERRRVTRSPLGDVHVLYEFAAPPAPGVYTVTARFGDAANRRTVTTEPAEFRVTAP